MTLEPQQLLTMYRLMATFAPLTTGRWKNFMPVIFPASCTPTSARKR